MSQTAKRKPVIALIISNLEFGGAQQQVVELANNLPAAKYDVHLVSLSPFTPLAGRLSIPADNQHVIEKRWKYDILVPFRLASLFRSIDATLVHSFLFDADIATRIAAKLASVPYVLGSERNCDYKLRRLQLLAYRMTKSLQTRCVANSTAGAKYNSSLLGYPIGMYDVVHNGVNTERFHPGNGDDVRSRHGIPASSFVVGVFGSFKPQKNHKLFFQAAADLLQKHQDLTFLVVGDQLHGGIHGSDAYKTEVNSLVDELGIRPNCVFAGNQNGVEEYYRACDITVLPSNHEGMPNVVLESLASGTPVVATDVSDNRQLIVDEEIGFLIGKGDLSQLVARITELIEDAALRQRMSNNAVDWINKKFSANRMAQKMARSYDAVLAT